MIKGGIVLRVIKSQKQREARSFTGVGNVPRPSLRSRVTYGKNKTRHRYAFLILNDLWQEKKPSKGRYQSQKTTRPTVLPRCLMFRIKLSVINQAKDETG